MSKRRSFSPEFKAQIVIEILAGRSIGDVCREHQIKYDVVARWKNQFLHQAPRLFQPENARPGDSARIAELERLIGQLTVELDILKKASTLWSGRINRNGS